MVSIIIPVYNQHELTEECINAVLENTSGEYEIIIIDNGSDPSIHLPFTGLVESCIVRNEENKGFPAAINQGIQESSGDVICLLNNDCIVTPGWLDTLLPHLDQFDIIGPVTNYSSGMQQVSADSYSNKDELNQSAASWAEAMAGTDPTEVKWIIGFCMMFKQSTYDLTGPFDESIWPACGEEIDFCLRARQSGLRIAIVPSVYVHHEGSKTFEDMNKEHPYSEIINKCDKHLISKWGKNVYEQEIKSGCKVHIVTLFSRHGLLNTYLKFYRQAGVIWHVIQFCNEEIIANREDWIRPFIIPDIFTPDSMLSALNHFIQTVQIEDDDYYAMTPDDDLFEPGVLEKIKTFSNDVVVISMKRGDNIPDDGSIPHGTDTLIAHPDNMLINHIGGEQLFLKGRVFKKYLYREDYYGADGLLAEQLKANEPDIRYESDLYILFNYFQSGRWNEIEIKAGVQE